MVLYIKYMVSLRCKMVVKTELENLGVHFRFIELGTVEIMDDFTAEQRKSLHKTLLKSGFELMDDKKAVLIEKIKNVIIEMVHYTEELPQSKFFRLHKRKTGFGLYASFKKFF